MTLVETMVVVAIIGLLAALAVPAVGDLSAGFRAKAYALEVSSAIAAGRDYSQKLNAVVQVRWDGAAIVLDAQDLPEEDVSEQIIKVVDNGNWVQIRRFPISKAVTMISFPTQIYFCPTSEGRYRMDTPVGTMVCALGNISQSAPSNTGTADPLVLFKAVEKNYNVSVSAAIGTVKLRSGV